MNEEQRFALKFLLDSVGEDYPNCNGILRELLEDPKPVQIPEADLQKAATTRGRKVEHLWQFDDLGLSLFIHDIARLYVENGGKS